MSPPRDRLLLTRREHTWEQETAATDSSCYSLFPRCGADLALDILEAQITTENILQKFCVIQRLGKVSHPVSEYGFRESKGTFGLYRTASRDVSETPRDPEILGVGDSEGQYDQDSDMRPNCH
ncbi:hypothetical protein B0H11DRAFT_1914913 [Mycena galericulata]|nr:hypothetical protein B0H11DRAFT_1914913 [Mycena galericulata]